MGKTKKEPQKKYTALFVILAILFILILVTVVYQFDKYDGKNFIPTDDSSSAFLIISFILIPILLALFIGIAFTKSKNIDLATKEYFSVDFKKMDKERQPLKSMDVLDEQKNLIKNYTPETVKYAPEIKEEIKTDDKNEETKIKITQTNIPPVSHKEETNDGESRFYMLTEIDKSMESYIAPRYNDEVTLKTFCEEFRNYACRELRLYYDIEDIRRFIGALSVTKLIVLQGMSGTGKTSLAYAFGEFLDNKTVVVPIQPMWKERTDLIGYYNEFTKKFNETTLLYKMYEANCNEEIYITVLDEMNIARVEYYFAEFLSLLEIPNPDGRNLDVVADKWDNDPKLLVKGKLRLPTNMWFIGTANNDDSTFSISDKVYDRAMVLNFDKKATPFDAPRTPKMKVSATHLYELFERAQREYDISDRNLRRIKKLDEYLIKTFHITFGNRIMKQIRAYVPVLVACGGTELEALDDILSRKVFRKLESKNPVYVKQAADGVCAYLDELFGVDKMPLCKEAIRLIEQNI